MFGWGSWVGGVVLVVEGKGGGVLQLVLGTEPGPKGEGGVQVRGEGGGREVEEEGGKCL